MSYYNEKADQVSDTQTYTDSVDTLGMNLGLYEANGIPFPLYGFTSSIIEPFGVSMLGLPWREAMYNRGDFAGVRRLRRRDLAPQRQDQPDGGSALHAGQEGIHLDQWSA